MRTHAGSLGATRNRSARSALVTACVVALVAGACSGGSGTHSAGRSKNTSSATRGKERANGVGAEHGDKGDKDAGPEAHGLDLHLHQDARGNVRGDLYRAATEQFKHLRVDAGKSASRYNGAIYGGNALSWKQIGPGPATVNPALATNGQRPGPNAGAVMDIAISPAGATDKTAFAVFNDGGVWKTTNGGGKWIPTTDSLDTLSFGAVALDPVNPAIVYAGTGNIFNNGYFEGIGVYVSTNAGKTWSLTAGHATLNGKGITKIVVPSPNVLLVATSAGLFRSANGGTTFTEIAVGGTNGSYITDLDLRPGTTSPIWASVSSRGIFASTDVGLTFTNNLWASGHGSVPTAATYQLVSFATSSDGQTLYANAQNLAYGLKGVWKSINAGATWSDITANATPNVAGVAYWRQVTACQCGYDQTIGVDPVDANRVYMGFQDMWTSDDGGTSWSDITSSAGPAGDSGTEKTHVDHHALTFSPASHLTGGDTTSRLWVGNDGGIWLTDDAGTSWTNRNATIATNLFRGIDTGHGNVNNQWTYGGMQDTGTAVRAPGMNGTEWKEYCGGDGWPTAVDWQDPHYAHGQWGSGYCRTTDGGTTSSYATPPCSSPGFVAPAVDPNDGNNVYLARDCGNPVLFRSKNRGVSFTSLYTRAVGAQIASVATTPADSSVVWLGYTDGSIVKLTVDGTGVTSSTVFSIAGRIAGQSAILAVDQNDAGQVMAVFAGYSGVAAPGLSKHVYATGDNGAHWDDVSGYWNDPVQRVPDTPVYAAVFDPHSSAMIVATDSGVLRSVEGGATWQVLGTGLPNVHVTSLAIDATVSPAVLKAGTFGRSTWQLSIPPVPNADYLFAFTLASSVAPAPALTNVGPGANTFVGNSVDGNTRPVLKFRENNGLRLAPTTSVLTNSGTYTVSALVRLDAVDGYRRVFDPSDGTTDNGLYVDNGFLEFYPVVAGSKASIAAKKWVQITLTRDATSKVVAGYVNGVQQFSAVDSADTGVVDASTVMRFFIDNDCGTGVCGEASGGRVARLRVFPYALTATEVKYLDRLPATGPPILTAVAPAAVPDGSSNVPLKIMGTNFTPNTTVVFSPYLEILSVAYISSTQLTVKVNIPAMSPSQIWVLVESDLGYGLCTTCFTVT